MFLMRCRSIKTIMHDTKIRIMTLMGRGFQQTARRKVDMEQKNSFMIWLLQQDVLLSYKRDYAGGTLKEGWMKK